MYEKFEILLKEKGITSYRVSKDTGISGVTLSEWKNGKYTPKHDKLQKIANYFSIPVSYFSEDYNDHCHEKLQLTFTGYTDDRTPLDKIYCIELMLNQKSLVIAGFPSASLSPVRLNEILDDRSLATIKSILQRELDVSKMRYNQEN